MDKNKWIEEKVKEIKKQDFVFMDYGSITIDDEENKRFESFLRQSLEEAYTLGSMQGYKEGIHSKDAIKEIVEHMSQSK